MESGPGYFQSMRVLIDRAVHLVHLQVYIFSDDTIGREIANSLMAAAQRGVKVFLLVDGFGSSSLSDEFTGNLRKAGVQFRFFSPVRLQRLFSSGRRMHQKILVVDGRWSLVGGLNVSDRYHGTAQEPAWKDYAISFEGPLSAEVNAFCEKVWLKKYLAYPWRKQIALVNPTEKGVEMRLRINDGLRNLNQISSTYRKALRSSDDEILIMASYFTPSRRLLNTLLRASARGIRVNIVLAGESDVPFMKPAIEFLYRRLLKAGIGLYEYLPAVLHAKVCVVDRKWMSIGSYNLNRLSEFYALEANIDVRDTVLASELAGQIEKVMQTECRKVELEETKLSGIQKLRRWFSFQLISASTSLVTFFIPSRREE